MRFLAILASLLAVSGAAVAHPGSGPAHDLAHAVAGQPAAADDILAMIVLALVAVGAVFALRRAISRRASKDR